MPVVEASVTVPVPPEVAFAVSQTTTPVRFRWDPFIREQHFVGGAERPGKGVRSFSRHTVATWRYSFRCRRAVCRPVADRVGVWLLRRDIRRRIAGYASGCTDPVVVAAASEV